MANFSYTVTNVMGIPIRLNISILLMIFILISDFGTSLGIALGIGLIISICLHELAHSYVAIKKGCRVVSIDLMLLGGIAKMESMPEKPLDEFQMAIAGPAMSMAIGLALYLGIPDSLLNSTPYPLPFILIVLKYTGIINIGLALFNLLPAFPMDGGRIFRSLLAHKMGRLKATFIASRLGKVMAICMALYAFLGKEHVMFTLLLIAGFVFMSAGSEYKYVLMQEQAKQNRNNNPFENLFNQFKGFTQSTPPKNDEPFDADVVEITPPPYEKKQKSKKSKIFKEK